MSLASFFESIPEKQRNLQLGLACDNPMSGAFPHKRVVHAGLNGTLISPEGITICMGYCNAWYSEEGKCSVLIFIFHSARQNVRTVGSSKNGTSQSIEDNYIDGLIGELKLASECPRLKDGLIHAVFIGGGTPTSLSPANSERLLKAIKEYLPLANDYELT